MSVKDLQDSLARVAEQARDYSDLLKKFKSQNEDDLIDAMTVLEGTRTDADSSVQSALDEAGESIDEAARAMRDAADAADDYAQSI